MPGSSRSRRAGRGSAAGAGAARLGSSLSGLGSVMAGLGSETAACRACVMAKRPPWNAVRSGFHPTVATESAANRKKMTMPPPTAERAETSSSPVAAPSHPAAGVGWPAVPPRMAMADGTRTTRPAKSVVQRSAVPWSTLRKANAPQMAARMGSDTAPTPMNPVSPARSASPATPTMLREGKTRAAPSPKVARGIRLRASSRARANSPRPHSSRRCLSSRESIRLQVEQCRVLRKGTSEATR